jgi:hypothetical protein
VRVTDGGMLRARVLAALLRVRPKPNFHRNDDRKLGEGMQGCARCGLFKFCACNGRVFRAPRSLRPCFEARERGKKPNLHTPKDSAPREF